MTIVAVCSIIRKNNKILITQRSKDDVYPNLWDLPGGQLNHGEDVVSGVKREIKEECALGVFVLSPIDVASKIFDGKHIILITYLSDYRCGEIKLSEEHQNFKWIHPKTAAKMKNLTSLTKHAINTYLKSIST